MIFASAIFGGCFQAIGLQNVYQMQGQALIAIKNAHPGHCPLHRVPKPHEMRAAQHYGLETPPTGRQLFLDAGAHLGGIRLSGFHQFHQFRAGHVYRIAAVFLRKLLIFFQFQRGRSGQHRHQTVPRVFHRRLQRRFQPQHGQRELFPQGGRRRRGGGIAGDDDGLYILFQQATHHFHGVILNLPGGMHAVRCVGVIPPEDETFPGQGLPQGLQGRHAAEAGIHYANGPVIRHKGTPP